MNPNLFDNLFKENSKVPTLWQKCALVSWLCFGTVFPLVTIFLNREFVFRLWIDHADIFIASCASILVESSIIGVMIVFILKLKQQNKIISVYELNVEQLVVERTKVLHDTLANLEIVASTDHS